MLVQVAIRKYCKHQHYLKDVHSVVIACDHVKIFFHDI